MDSRIFRRVVTPDFGSAPGFAAQAFRSDHGDAFVAPGIVTEVVGDQEIAAVGCRAREVDEILRVRPRNFRRRIRVLYDFNRATYGFLKGLLQRLENRFLRSDCLEVAGALINCPLLAIRSRRVSSEASRMTRDAAPGFSVAIPARRTSASV